MIDDPGFDPYAVLGVGVEADEFVIQLAYRARIREAHPDVAGADGLERAKRLNVARDWLLDPERRSRLARSHAEPTAPAERPAWSRSARAHWGSRGAGSFDDNGPRAEELRVLLRSIGSLDPDERARVNYSLGDGRPMLFEAYRDYLAPELWDRSQQLRDAVMRAWSRGADEPAPHLPSLGWLLPSGALVANAYAQWLLLGDTFREELGAGVFRGEYVMDHFTARCVGPWRASVDQPRYGPYDEHVRSFLASAAVLSPPAARRLAHSWRERLGRSGEARPNDRIGPGVWLPSPTDIPEVLRVSGYLAAVDASRLEAPTGLDHHDLDDFRHGLRLTAHVLAMGPLDGSMRTYLQPWLDAVGPDRSRWQAAG